MLQDIWQDIRYGLRMLRKSAVFTLVAVLTLSLGIGANAAIFSVVNAFLLRPMPVKDADRLVVVAVTHEGNYDPHNVSHADYLDYRQGTDVFEDWAGYYISFVGIAHGGRAERSTVVFVTPGYFQMLGVPAKEGRVLLPQEGEKPGADPVVVLGHSYWMNRFGGAKDIVNQVVTINGRAATVVGVVPEWFHGTYSLAEMDAYMPLGMAATLDPSYKESLTKRDNHDLRVLARLKPGVSVSQAQAALDVVAKRLETQFPETNKTVRAHAFLERLARPEPNNADKSPIVAGLFLLLTGLVLLVACVNVANLLLVRATLREKEMAIRAALGAGRVRLLRQLLTESVLLAAAGAGGGLLVAEWIVRLLEQVRLPGDLPFRFDFQMDVRVFVFVAGVALVAGLGVGLLPALRAGRANLMGVLHEGGRSLAAGAGRHRTRNVLVVSQVAGALVLLVVAALFVRSLGNAQSVDLGFDPKGVMNFALDPMQQGYDETRSRALFEELERRVRALPGVDAVSYAYSPPLGYYNSAEYVNAEGQYVPDQRRPISGFNLVGPDYFTV
ncbi:MAG TPA: ABC transporter permease, partial [Candidatus Nitrosotenuis sp.]|nr:ABC transporter permease [Candidatus Nitrosotenuis sp.]